MSQTPTPPTTPEWTDLAIAAQVTVSKDSVLDPYSKEVIAKITDGFLDVRRPGAAHFPKPSNVKLSGDLATTFGVWFRDACYLSAVTNEDVAERTGIKTFALPEVEISPSESPLAVITGNFDGKEWCILYAGGSPVRVGLRTKASYLWTFSAAHVKQRPGTSPRSSACKDAEDFFKKHMGSFKGKFRGGDAAPAPKTKAKKPSKPSKPTIKKVPVKKK